MLMNDEAILLASLAGFVALLLFIPLCIYAVIKVFRLAIRWLRWSALNAGNSPAVALICFAIAAYLFPYPLTFIVSALWQVTIESMIFVSRQIQQQLFVFNSGCDSARCVSNA